MHNKPLLILICFCFLPLFLLLVSYKFRTKLSSLENIFNIGGRAPARATKWLVVLYFVSLTLLAILKYQTLNTTIMDLGIFDSIVWEISNFDFSLMIQGHFQPILFIHALFYKYIVADPIFLIVSQSLLIGLSIIPLIKICKLNKLLHLEIFWIVLIFLLNGSVQYNIFFDFHTDHIAFMIFFWALYFYLKGNFFRSFIIISISCLLKEPFFLICSFWGLMCALKSSKVSKRLFGLVASLTYFILFYYVLVNLQGDPMKEGDSNFQLNSSYAYLGSTIKEIIIAIIFEPHKWIKELFVIGKMQYIMTIFSPFLFLSIRRWWILIPAIPPLAISLLSQLPNYYGTRYHYTAHVVPFLLVAFIIYLKDKKTEVRRGVILGSVILSSYLTIINGPLPISLSFWYPGTKYHYSNYFPAQNIASLKKAITMIPSNADVSIQNNINYKSLTQRKNWRTFPEYYDSTNYILLDLARKKFLVDTINKDKYYAYVKAAKENFDVIFEENDVILLKRKSN